MPSINLQDLKIQESNGSEANASSYGKELDSTNTSTPVIAGPHLKDQDKLFQDFFSTPLFMTESPQGKELESNETLSAIQSLLYDAPPMEVATNFKNQGNEAFQAKQFKESVNYYSKAIEAKCDDVKMNSIFFSNRAAAQIHLGTCLSRLTCLENYGKALSDCGHSIRLNPRNIKAYYRSLKALLALDKLQEALQLCDLVLQRIPEDSTFLDHQRKIQEKINAQELAKEKARLEKEAKARAHAQLMDAIHSRNIEMISSFVSRAEDSDDEPPSSAFGTFGSEHCVHLDENQRLEWPVIFLYPEYQESDMIASFHEDHTFTDHLQVIFESSAPWDLKQEYRMETVDVFFETKQDPSKARDEFKPKLLRAGKDMSLGAVLSNKNYKVVDGVATFFIIPSGSDFGKTFRQAYK